MNSVISAFKTKKNSNSSNSASSNNSMQTVVSANNDKQHSSLGLLGSTLGAKKKTISSSDNGYQYLRHIREIDTATKLLSPVVMADELLETADMLNFRANSVTAVAMPSSPGMDVVDHVPGQTVHFAGSLEGGGPSTDCNMNGSKHLSGELSSERVENGNCSAVVIANGQHSATTSPTRHLNEPDDDESEHSITACTSTTSSSSSSEHSNSTVVHSPIVVSQLGNASHSPSHQQLRPVSPTKSTNFSINGNSSSSTLSSSSVSSTFSSTASVALCNSGPSSCSSTTSCDASSVCSVNDTSAPSSPILVTRTSHTRKEYVPAFLKSTQVTLPIIMPNSNSSLATLPSSSQGVNSAATTPKHGRYGKPRLSLSRFINHSMPSVHGRPNLSLANGAMTNITGDDHSGNQCNGANPPKRPSTHQRNLSLDFRSMGILLPPVSQVTNTRINLTQHHRNRSLDSALQRIPEVEVSSPNAENENTFCTPSILGSTMCSKIVTTAANVTAALTTTQTPALTSANNQSPFVAASPVAASAPAAVVTSESVSSAVLPAAIAPTPPPPTTHTSVLKPSVIVKPYSSMLRTRPKSNESERLGNLGTTTTTGTNIKRAHSSSSSTCSNSSSIVSSFGAAKNLGVPTNATVTSAASANNKKREDLTSLGSDDSGIICGSDSDQISLNRIRHSHESLDSGEMDAEEECIDMLETTSMDEEYNMLQSDLCFYQSPETDCQTLKPARKKAAANNNETKSNKHVGEQGKGENCTPSDQGAAGDCEVMTESKERLKIHTEIGAKPEINVASSTTDVTEPSTPIAVPPTVIGAPTAVAGVVGSKTQKTPDSGSATTTPIETPKNEVLFRNFFGATKNVIFRTAQSIIENHEKKNAAKQNNKNADDTASAINSGSGSGSTLVTDQIKSPTDVSKKKEFFSLLTTKGSKSTAAANASISANAAAVSTTPTTTTSGEQQQAGGTCGNVQAGTALKTTEKELPDCLEKTLSLQVPPASTTACSTSMSKSSSISSLQKLKVPGVVKCFIKERPQPNQDISNEQKTEKSSSGLLRFFESPVFNIHFAIHYLFYSKEPGVLSFIGNKIFSFPDQEVDLYIPQLIVMYIQMDELAEVLDPYLTIRCRKSVDFSLKCLWLLEAYNYQPTYTTGIRKTHLALMKEIYSKKERKQLGKTEGGRELTATVSAGVITPVTKKTHHRSQSDATVLLADSKHCNTNLSISNRLYQQQQPHYNTQNLPTTPAKLCLGDLSSGRAFDNGCACFETVRGQVNDLLGHKTVCSCTAPKTAPQKEFMKALMNVGKNLTALPSKAEKTSALRMFLNLINKNLPARVWLPLYSDIPHHVVRITEEKTAVLNSKDKTPYIIYVEVVEVSDIYSSSLIPKMMPSLRHTKSEEHLECGTSATCKHALLQQQPHLACSRTSSCSSHSGRLQGQRKKEKPVTENSESTREPYTTNQHTHNCESSCSNGGGATAVSTSTSVTLAPPQLNEDDVWSQEDDEITAQYLHMRKMRNNCERDAISQMSLDSCDSRDPSLPVLFNIGDVRTRHCNNLNCENTKSFSNDPEDPSAAALKEPWHEKEKQIRDSSPYGHLSNWRLLSAIVKCGDDLRQELMATQLLQMFKIIWQEESVNLWVRPYKIVCLSNDSGLIEPILNTVSLHQIKKNSNKSLYDYFVDEYGPSDSDDFRLAQKNFVQSCAAYCIISYLLQVKDRHNGNILLHSDGHIIHIDFGFILNISPKNLGFEQSPFKLTPEFVDVMGGTDSEHWREFNRLLLVGMMTARKHMDRIINFVEIMRSNAQLPCFKNGCSGTVQNLRKRFHMNLTEQEMERKVEQLVQDSLKSLSTKLYDGYQYYTNGIL